MAKDRKIPHETGFYWAKASGYEWYNLIVRIYGEAPFLKADSWEYVEGKVTRNISFYGIETFGPQITDLVEGPE